MFYLFKKQKQLKKKERKNATREPKTGNWSIVDDFFLLLIKIIDCEYGNDDF